MTEFLMGVIAGITVIVAVEGAVIVRILRGDFFAEDEEE